MKTYEIYKKKGRLTNWDSLVGGGRIVIHVVGIVVVVVGDGTGRVLAGAERHQVNHKVTWMLLLLLVVMVV